MRQSFVWFAVLFVITSVAMMESFQGAGAVTSESPTVIYSHGGLHVTIPYRAPHTGAGQLTVEVLDPEDQSLGRVERRVNVEAGKGAWEDDVRLTTALTTDDLVWHRIRYRFTYSDQKDAAIEGTESISQILRMPVIHILGQQSYLTGGQAGVRVIVRDSRNDAIGGPGSLRSGLS